MSWHFTSQWTKDLTLAPTVPIKNVQLGWWCASSTIFIMCIYLTTFSCYYLKSPLILCLHWHKAVSSYINHRCFSVSTWPRDRISLLTTCSLFDVLFVVNSNQAELDFWLWVQPCVRRSLCSCVWRILPIHRETILPPVCSTTDTQT